MDKLGKNKRKWLEDQGCKFVEEKEYGMTNTYIYTKEGEYIDLADLGDNASNVNLIYKNKLTQLSSIGRAEGKPEQDWGAVSLGFNEEEQAWYGWTHRGYAHFAVGDTVKKGSAINPNSESYKVKDLEQAKDLAIKMANYLD